MNVLQFYKFHLNHSERGVAILEFALIFGILILLGFSSIDIDRLLHTDQSLSVISREVANSASRSCAGLPMANSCLATLVADLQTPAGSLFPGMEVTASVYKCNSYSCDANCALVPCTCTCSGGVTQTGFATTSTGSLSQATHYDETKIFAQFRSTLNLYGSVSVGEVLFTQRELLAFPDQDRYEVSIF